MADAPEPWTTLSSRVVYENPWISVREDIARMPDGRQTIYGVITGADAMGVLPFVDDDHVILVQQWRYVANRLTWEMPTGGRKPGETLNEALQRELAEEIGMKARSIRPLSVFHTSKSVMDETAYLYAATDLEPADVPPDDTEFIGIRTFPFDEVLAMVLSGEITDAMTIVAVLLTDRERRAR
jgi:ADP-ribose pyrophosphatase